MLIINKDRSKISFSLLQVNIYHMYYYSSSKYILLLLLVVVFLGALVFLFSMRDFEYFDDLIMPSLKVKKRKVTVGKKHLHSFNQTHLHFYRSDVKRKVDVVAIITIIMNNYHFCFS